MKACPWCAEQIQDEARVCRFCGRGSSEEPRKPLNQPGRYDVPFRFERQAHSGGGGSDANFSSSSSGIALKGSVCPSCKSPDYVNTFTIWHGVLAIFAFPLGLIGFAFPVKNCAGCSTQYGAGREMVKVVKFLFIVFVLLLGLVFVGSFVAGFVSWP